MTNSTCTPDPMIDTMRAARESMEAAEQLLLSLLALPLDDVRRRFASANFRAAQADYRAVLASYVGFNR